jgi:hypothetical protein
MSSGQAQGGRRRGAVLKTIGAIAVSCWLAVTSSAAQAQPRRQPAPQPNAQPVMPQAKPGNHRRLEIKRKLMAFRAYRVTEELALDEATAALVFPLLAKYDQKVDQLTVERVKLHKALRSPPAETGAIDDLIRRALANRRALLDLEEQRLNELRKVLSAQQTARLLVLIPQIERQIKAQIRRSVQQDRNLLSPSSRQRNRDRKPDRDQQADRDLMDLDDVE